MDFGHKPGSADSKSVMFQGWGGRRLGARVLILALVLSALRIVYVIRNEVKAENCAFSQGTTGIVSFDGLPPLSTTYGSGAIKPRYNFKTDEEYIQLQVKKTLNLAPKQLWTSRDWRRKVDVFSNLFMELMKKNLLKPEYKALCVGARAGQEVLALKEIGVQDAIGIDLVPSPPLVVQGDMHKQPFPKNTFDFEFSNVFDHALFTAVCTSEIERTLKPGGIAVIHVSLKRHGDKYSANDFHNVDSLTCLFKHSELVYSKEVDAFGLVSEIVLRKRSHPEEHTSFHEVFEGGFAGPNCQIAKAFETEQLSGKCPVLKLKQKIIDEAEPLITEEPRKPWITLKQNLKKIKYLPNLSNISNNRRYVYIDVGARNYGSSVGSWFKKVYPKQNQRFLVYAIEADKSFAPDYQNRKDVKLLPFAAWTRNESLVFGVRQENLAVEGDIGMGRIQGRSVIQEEESSGVSLGTKSSGNRFMRVQGFDFAKWLNQTVSTEDFVVMKMDVEGTEFDLLQRMFETGAICLVDELFLECHYNRWQRSSPKRTSKFDRTYGQCLALFGALRNNGVLVHQWW